MGPPAPEPIAVDPGYRLRDNQFWYSDCRFADRLADAARVTLRVEGLGVRTLTRAAPGRDGRPTTSFTLRDRSDRRWWEEHRGRHVRVELLAVHPGVQAPSVPPGVPRTSPPRPTAREPVRPEPSPAPDAESVRLPGSVLCIGLDVAWFGGSAGDRDSRYDCLAWACLTPGGGTGRPWSGGLERVALPDRDPRGDRLLGAIDVLLETHGAAGRVVFAVDAPVQASPRPRLGVRPASPKRGEVQPRACDRYLGRCLKAIDRAAGGSGGWHPNVQPGAPLPPRVMNLLSGLRQRGFSLWTEADRGAIKLVIECFPAEAIWAMRRLGRYPPSATAERVKEYKGQRGTHLTSQQVRDRVRLVLGGFAADSGDPGHWGRLVDDAVARMLADRTWQPDPGKYRGGKLLDDVVESLICLATASSYAHGLSHVWQDPDDPDDGHIIGPGRLDHLVAGIRQATRGAAAG